MGCLEANELMELRGCINLSRVTLQEFQGCWRFDCSDIRVLHGAQRVEPICGSSSSLKLQLGLVHGEPVSAQLLGIVPNRVSLLYVASVRRDRVVCYRSDLQSGWGRAQAWISQNTIDY